MTIAYKCCNCPRTKYVSWNGYCGDGYPVELAILGALTEEELEVIRFIDEAVKATFVPEPGPEYVLPQFPADCLTQMQQLIWAFDWQYRNPPPPEPPLVENLCGVCRYSLLYTEEETAAKVLELEARNGEPPMVGGDHVVIQIDRSLG